MLQRIVSVPTCACKYLHDDAQCMLTPMTASYSNLDNNELHREIEWSQPAVADTTCNSPLAFICFKAGCMSYQTIIQLASFADATPKGLHTESCTQRFAGLRQLSINAFLLLQVERSKGRWSYEKQPVDLDEKPCAM